MDVSCARFGARCFLPLTLLLAPIAACDQAEAPAPAAAPSVIQDVANAWSPDGERILFTRYFPDGRADLFLVAVDGSALQRITDRPGKDEAGTFTPDGRHVTFCSDREGQNDIFRLDLDDGELENLTRHPADDCEHAWSRAGDRFVLHSDRDGERNMFVMAADGSTAERLTTAPGWDHVTAGAWSPDDRMLVYCSTAATSYVDEGPGKLDPFGLYLLDVDGDRTPRLLLDLPGEDSYPTFGPDGRTIYFAHKAPHGADDGASYDVYRVALDGRGAARFLGGPGDQYLPYWSPDGGTIVYFSEGSLWLADGDGVNPRPLEIPEGWTPLL